jgi:hypothetical protein
VGGGEHVLIGGAVPVAGGAAAVGQCYCLVLMVACWLVVGMGFKLLFPVEKSGLFATGIYALLSVN